MREPIDATPLLALTETERDGLLADLAALASTERLARMDAVLAGRTRRIAVVFEDLYHPHNASAVLRTAECLGVQDIHVVEGVKRFRPNVEVVHGAARWLTMHRWRKPDGHDVGSCLRALRAGGYRIAATTPDERAVALPDVSVEEPLALCFGTELTGITDTLLAEADLHVHLPMPGFTRSFNVSVTAAILLYDLTTRLRTSGVAWQLTPRERADLKLVWLAAEGRQARELVQARLASLGYPLPLNGS